MSNCPGLASTLRPLMVTLTYGFGVALAALAGVLAAPVIQINPLMGSNLIIVVFAVVVIGGIGSVRGAMIAALLVGLVDTFGKVLLPSVASMGVYVMMALVLLWRPQGLFKS